MLEGFWGRLKTATQDGQRSTARLAIERRLSADSVAPLSRFSKPLGGLILTKSHAVSLTCWHAVPHIM